jgi:hypothetical protein
MAASRRLLGTGLGLGRLAIGAGLWAAPQQVGRALGFERLDSAAVAVARIAATRDFLLGLAQLATLDDPRWAARAAAAGMSADAADAVAFAAAYAQGEREAGIRGLALALPATALGWWLWRTS